MPSVDPYAAIAQLYDFAYWDFDDDVEFYENLARINDGPVLELGAGSGRVAVRLAKAGFARHRHRHVAFDAGARPDQYEDASRRREDAFTWSEGSMTDFDLGAAVRPGPRSRPTRFSTCSRRQSSGPALRAWRAHLAPGGIFALSIRSPASLSWEDARRRRCVLDWTRRDAETGDLVMKLVASEPDAARMMRHLTYVYDRVAPDGGLRRTVFETDLRFSTQAEIELLLQEAGLRVTHVYGDYDLTPVGPSTEQLIFVARGGSRT